MKRITKETGGGRNALQPDAPFQSVLPQNRRVHTRKPSEQSPLPVVTSGTRRALFKITRHKRHTLAVDNRPYPIWTLASCEEFHGFRVESTSTCGFDKRDRRTYETGKQLYSH